MRCRIRSTAPLLVFLVIFALPVSAGAKDGPAASELRLVLPPPGQPLFDEVVFEASVPEGVGVDRVEFRVDDKVVGDRHEPPWRLEADVGPENRDRRLEVLAYAGGGVISGDERTAPAVEVDEVVDLHLQQIFVTVTDADGRRVLGLQKEDFAVFDQGVEQELVTLQGGDVPFTAVLLLDTSESMKGEGLRAAIEGARRFVEGMKPLDEAKVVAASDRILRASPWSARSEDLRRSFAGLEAQGGTSIFDPLFLSLTLLESRLGRRVLVLLGDGWDNHSVLGAEDLLETARRMQTTIYWVRVGAHAFDPAIERRRRTRREDLRRRRTDPNFDSLAPRVTSAYGAVDREFGHLPIPVTSWRTKRRSVELYLALEEIVEATGGRIVNVAERSAVGPAFGEILQELREQYALGYYPQPRSAAGTWRPVEVRVDDEELEVRTREGYVAR